MKLFQRLDRHEGDSTYSNSYIQFGKKFQSSANGSRIHNGYYLILRSPFIKKHQSVISPYTFTAEKADVRTNHIWIWRRFKGDVKLTRLYTSVYVPIKQFV